jgi:hypothetical protein
LRAKPTGSAIRPDYFDSVVDLLNAIQTRDCLLRHLLVVVRRELAAQDQCALVILTRDKADGVIRATPQSRCGGFRWPNCAGATNPRWRQLRINRRMNERRHGAPLMRVAAQENLRRCLEVAADVTAK